MHLGRSRCFPRKKRAFNSSSPPLVQGTKNVNETRGVSPRAQIKSIYSGEHIKRKPLMNPSKIIFTLSLKLIISTKKTGLEGENLVSKCRRKTHLWNSHPQLSNPDSHRFLSRAYQTKAQNMRFKLVTCKHDLFKTFWGGRVIQTSDYAHPKHNLIKKKKSGILCVCICCVCVCERERERERKWLVQFHYWQAIKLKHEIY